MNALSASLVTAQATVQATVRGWHLAMPWFAPCALALGALGSRTGWHARHLARKTRDSGWWLIILMAWLPLLYWIAAQFVKQD